MSLFTERSALLIVDMINDFVDPEGSLFVPGAAKIIPYISSLAREARERGIPVIYANDVHSPDDKELEDWGEHAVEGTWGAEMTEGLEPQDMDYSIEKSSFSAFHETDLEVMLDRLRVDHLVITGTVTNICIYATALGAYMRGFKVTVPERGVAGLDEKDHNFALEQIDKTLKGEVIPE